MRRTADDVITIGQALIRQKAALPHGSFLPWIEAEFGMSGRAANRFMNVADAYGGKSDRLADLGLEAMYELAAPSTSPEVQAEVERRRPRPPRRASACRRGARRLMLAFSGRRGAGTVGTGPAG
ncbi:MAG TPA: DUF3102 domain-containing protein, partial [Nitrobacter sp.]|nr:DUF3102 domain-containing protein [Nitrobacter sp.]